MKRNAQLNGIETTKDVGNASMRSSREGIAKKRKRYALIERRIGRWLLYVCNKLRRNDVIASLWVISRSIHLQLLCEQPHPNESLSCSHTSQSKLLCCLLLGSLKEANWLWKCQSLCVSVVADDKFYLSHVFFRFFNRFMRSFIYLPDNGKLIIISSMSKKAIANEFFKTVVEEHS